MTLSPDHTPTTGRSGLQRPIGFSISIDTEEDNWVPATRDISTRSILELPRIAALFDRLGVRATYFTTYQVAAEANSAAVMRDLYSSGATEIGAHLHPWNTPPFSGLESSSSMLMTYPDEAQREKIDRLLDALSAIGPRPTAFRAGRFGVGESTIGILVDNGLCVDSSVTPLVSWRESEGPSFIGAPIALYRVGPGSDLCTPCASGLVTEVPITVGYTRFRPTQWSRMAKALNTTSARRFHLAGIASRLGIARKVILSPETSSAEDMMQVSRQMLADGAKHLHMYFHSNSLTPGLTPFVRTPDDAKHLAQTIVDYVERLRAEADVTYCTVSEAAELYGPPVGQAI